MGAARKLKAKIVTGIYLASAAFVLLQFWLAPPDGLANIWIAVWTLPVTLAGLALLYWPFGVEFPFVPSSGSLGHYGSHAIYFGGSCLLIAAALYRIISGKAS